MEHILSIFQSIITKFEGSAANKVCCWNRWFVTNFAVFLYSLQSLAWIDFIFRAEACSQVRL